VGAGRCHCSKWRAVTAAVPAWLSPASCTARSVRTHGMCPVLFAVACDAHQQPACMLHLQDKQYFLSAAATGAAGLAAGAPCLHAPSR
jgi:hypothetical protein